MDEGEGTATTPASFTPRASWPELTSPADMYDAAEVENCGDLGVGRSSFRMNIIMEEWTRAFVFSSYKQAHHSPFC
jgi:hypothetical protein